MLDIMYEVPSRNDVAGVTVTEDTVAGGEPEITLKSVEADAEEV